MRFSIPPWGVGIGVLILVGAGYSVWDYQAWRQAEYGHLGQGSPEEAQIAPSQVLDKWYQNKYVGVRMAYPSAWTTTESLSVPFPLVRFQPNKDFQTVVTFTKGEVATTLLVRAATKSLAEEVDQYITNLAPADKAREYLNSDKANITILTWTETQQATQRAFMTHDGKLFLLESVVTPTSAWGAYAKTFWSMYESVILL